MMGVVEDVLMATGALCWAVTAAGLWCAAVYEVRRRIRRRREIRAATRYVDAEYEELTR